MPSHSAIPSVPPLREQLVHESCSMVRRLVTNGMRVPPQLVEAADQFEAALAQGKPVDMAALAGTHERLSRLVAPAKPGTLYLLDYNLRKAGRWSSLGPVKQVRDLVKVAIGCVAVFILLSVLQLVEAHPDITVFGVTESGEPAHGMLILKVILERVFWLAAAGIGASFAMLFQLNDLIVTRTYDPDEAASYWVKFFLGVVAGFILVALVPIDAAADTGAGALGPPTVALLGGFSASAVYRILTRLVEALESIFSGGARDQAALAEKAASTRAAEENAQSRMAVAGELVDIQQGLVSGTTPEQATEQLRQVVAALMPAGTEAPARAAGRVPALALVAAPQAAAAPSDALEPAGAPGADAGRRDESAAAVG